MRRFEDGDRVRVDIPDTDDPEFGRYHYSIGEVVEVIEDDAGETTGDERDSYLFACRDCYDPGYLTSRRSGDVLKQAELRYQRAFRKADATDRRPHPNNASQWPTKPKGMHCETFADLLADMEDARDERERAFDQRLREMADPLDGLV